MVGVLREFCISNLNIVIFFWHFVAQSDLSKHIYHKDSVQHNRVTKFVNIKFQYCNASGVLIHEILRES